ncbi:HepT-like ribonuclease domain-containing protein [Hydrogenimonas sp.]
MGIFEMGSKRHPRLYLEEILEECANIRRFTEGIDYEAFTSNLEKVYAVAKAFENIGEAVKALPSDLLEPHREIPWREIAKMRDLLTHHYFGLDDKVLWDTVHEDLASLESAVTQILGSSED